LNNSAILAGTIGLLLGCGNSIAGEDPHWSYTGETGTEHWSELSPDYAACGIGVNQSPIDITDTISVSGEPLEADYTTGSVDIVNNGHTLQINAKPGNWLRVRGKAYELQQLHFHSPSEHRINGEAFPFEAHFVNKDDQDNFVVVAILFRSGEWNADLAKAGKAAPKEIGQSAPFDINFSALKMYRRHDSYFSYSGSLTTPPCTEGIRWYIVKATETISPEQVATFVRLIGEDARGPQPLNARDVLER
jgi:carbonic anhydrase